MESISIFQENVSQLLDHECMYTHFNFTVQRQRHQVTSYSFIKMGDYYWMGNHRNYDFDMAATMYANAARRGDPQVRNIDIFKELVYKYTHFHLYKLRDIRIHGIDEYVMSVVEHVNVGGGMLMQASAVQL